MGLRLLLGIVAALPISAHAEVLAVADGGFSVHHEIETTATPGEVYAAMQEIGDWWNPSHSWSGKGENLYLDATPGGCFCERLPDGGGVEHLRIIYLAPEKAIHFDGALGPLQGMATFGRMLWSIGANDSGSTVSFTYHVTGFMSGGFEGLAPAVDGVITEQLDRLANLLEVTE